MNELISKEEVLKALNKLIERKEDDLVAHAMLCGLGEEINKIPVQDSKSIYNVGYYAGCVDGRNNENKRILEMFKMLKANHEDDESRPSGADMRGEE